MSIIQTSLFFAKRYTLLLSIALLFFSYLLPIFYSPLAAFFHEALVFISVLLLCVYVILLIPVIRLNLFICLLLIACILPLLQYFTGTVFFSGDAVLACVYSVIAVAAYFLAQQYIVYQQRNRAFLCLAYLFFLLSFLQVWFALNQYFDVGTLDSVLMQTNARPFGNLRQPNNFASLLMLCFLSGWYLFEKNKFNRKAFYLWMFFIVMGLVLAQSRTTMLVGIIAVAFFVLFKSRLFLRTRYSDIAWMFICYLALWFILPELKYEVSESISGEHSALRDIKIVDNVRLNIWYESLLALWQGPLWGYGWNQIGVAQVLVDSPLEKTVHFRHAHNLFLDMLLYNGLIIGGLIVFGILWLIVKAFRGCHTIEGWFILAMIGAVFTHAMLEFPLHYVYFLVPVAFLFGLIDVDTNTNIWSVSLPSWCLLPVVAIGAVILVLLWKDYNIIRKEHFNLDIELTGMFARKPERERTDDIVLLTQRRNFLHFGRAEATENMSDEKIEWMRKVSHRFASPYYLSKYAKACQLNGYYDEANRVVKVIKRLFGEDMYQIAKLHIYEGVDND